jgi:membrane peptidoglycan carboxypeptidase
MTRLEDRIRTGLHAFAEHLPDAAEPVASIQSRPVRTSGGPPVAVAVMVGVLVVLGGLLLWTSPLSEPDVVDVADSVAPSREDSMSPTNPAQVETPVPTTAATESPAVTVRAADGSELGRIVPGEASSLSPLARAAAAEVAGLAATDVTVIVGIEPEAQGLAEAVLHQWLGDSAIDGAIVVVDNETGAILAAAGTSDARFLPGSARPVGTLVQPFVTIAALEAGAALEDQWDVSSPATIAIEGTEVTCRNAGSGGTSEMSLHDAIVRSIPTAFCRLVADLGPARAEGVVGRVWPTASGVGAKVAVGDFPVPPLHVAAAFRALATGHYRPATLVEEIVGADDPITPKPVELAAQRHLDVVGAALQDVVLEGSGGHARLEVPVGGSTGTTQGLTDAWFAGYTADVTTVVWVGIQNGTLENVEVHGQHYSAVYGGTLPASMWRDFMRIYLAG